MAENPFLNRVAEEVYHRHQQKLDEACVILPSRRATIFFRQHLAQIIQKPVWMPALMSLQDLVDEMYPRQLLDPLELNFILFQKYRQLQPLETFDNFYPWGQMLLKDFDDVDRYLVNAEKLFQNLKEIKQIEQWEPSALRFWQEIETDDPKPVQQRFYQLWEIAGLLYQKLQQHLEENNQGYAGMAYRWMAGEVSGARFQSNYDHLHFAGFNALSAAEEAIIGGLVNQGKATVYFDADPFYLDDDEQEAGRFIRKYLREWQLPEVKWIEPHLAVDKKQISIIGTSLRTEQTKALAAELAGQAKEQPDWEKTAVVLADQGLLFPVLNALPAEIKDVNVTMGYPLRFSPVYSLLDSLGQLHLNAVQKEEKYSFFYKDVLTLLGHPYLKKLKPGRAEELIQKLKLSESLYISDVILKEEDPLFNLIFSVPATPNEAAEQFSDILDLLHLAMDPDEEELDTLEMEFIFQYKKLLNRLQDIMLAYSVEMPLTTFRRLFREIIGSTSLPFSGEPLKGLQVMGMLETRTLDFENVYILSVNEGTLPSSSHSQSFIPYDLRKTFGLPAQEEQSALYAYHFYRLLQRASNIRLFYTTEAGSLGAGEKSRFLLQLEQILVKANPRINLKKYLYSSPVPTLPPREITITRDSQIDKRLSEWISGRGLSASALIMYSLCQLKFYFHYIMKLQEEDILTQELEASEFGSIFHDAMESLYLEKKGKKLQAVDFKQMKQNVRNAVKQGFRNVDRNFDEVMENRNFFDAETLRMLVEMSLDVDSKLPEFELVDLEFEASVGLELPNGTQVKLYGKIDRIDRSYDGVRIVDYKTGSIKSFKFSLEDPEVTVNNKEAFQVLFYAYLYYRLTGESRLIPTVLPLKQVVKGYVNFPKQEKVLNKEVYNKFEQYLSSLIKNVLSAPNFAQTQDLTVCQYCAFNSICLRN